MRIDPSVTIHSSTGLLQRLVANWFNSLWRCRAQQQKRAWKNWIPNHPSEMTLKRAPLSMSNYIGSIKVRGSPLEEGSGLTHLPKPDMPIFVAFSGLWPKGLDTLFRKQTFTTRRRVDQNLPEGLAILGANYRLMRLVPPSFLLGIILLKRSGTLG